MSFFFVYKKYTQGVTTSDRMGRWLLWIVQRKGFLMILEIVGIVVTVISIIVTVISIHDKDK